MIPLPPVARRIFRPKILVAVGTLAAAGALWAFFTGGDQADRENAEAFHRAERGEFTIALPTGGSLEAVDEVTVSNRVPGRTQIINLVKEGAIVEKGDLLIELDSSDIENRLSQAEIQYQQSVSSVAEHEENFQNIESENVVNLRDAELALEFARKDLEKYEGGEWPQLRKEAESAISLASEELRRAKDRLDGTRRLEEKGYATPSELVADELAVKRREIELQSAEENRRLLIEFDDPRQRRQLEADLKNARVKLDRTRSQNKTRLDKAEMRLISARETLDLRKEHLEELRDAEEYTEIRAPQSGLVVYKETGWRRDPIEEGAEVRERQDLLALPDVSRMKVRVNIYENQISLVETGMRANITLDALPDQSFAGEVTKIASMPEPAREGNPNYRVYKAEVVVTDDMPEIKPGVTAKVDVLVAELEDVIKVPLQAVVGADDRQFCFVRRGGELEPVEVQVGLFDSDFVEIKEGLEEGDLVSLVPPTSRDFAPDGGDEDETPVIADPAPEEDDEEDGLLSSAH